jgi:sec-independent protein translocase protein TatB
MFGFDWPELIIIGIVALIFIGPEDLPDMFRQLGRFTAKLRQMSREFSRAMEQAAKDTGVSDVARDLKTSTSVKGMGLDKMREAADKFEKWDPIKSTVNPAVTMPARALTPPPVPAAMTPPAGEVPAVVEEINDDLAAIAEVDAEPTIHGPATQALYDKQALRAKVLAEQTEKLKAIEAGTYEPAVEVAKPAPRKRAVKPQADTDTPPKTTRKKKADNA